MLSANSLHPLTLARFPARLSSPLPGVSPEAWHRYAKALEIQPIKAMSPSGGYGCYDLRPRRLVELGLATDLRPAQTPAGRRVYTCTLKPPLSEQRLLEDPLLQEKILGLSLRRYQEALAGAKMKRPEGVSLAGALAILHIAGEGGLAGWPDLFPKTRVRFEAARGAF